MDILLQYVFLVLVGVVFLYPRHRHQLVPYLLVTIAAAPALSIILWGGFNFRWYHELFAVFQRLAFAAGVYGAVQTRAWRRTVFWVYLLVFPVPCYLQYERILDHPALFWAMLLLTAGVILMVNHIVCARSRNKGLSFTQLGSLFLCLPVTAFFWGRTVWGLLDMGVAAFRSVMQ